MANTPSSKKESSLLSLSGVGPQLADKLQKLGIHAPRDLLFHLPLRYEDRTRITPISELKNGEPALIVGRVAGSGIRYGRRRNLVVGIEDETGSINFRFFHFSGAQQRGFKNGVWIHAYGEPRFSQRGVEMVHPEYRIHNSEPGIVTERALTPVYPSTEGIGPSRMRNLVFQGLSSHTRELDDLIPERLVERFNLMPLQEALAVVHQPAPDADTRALMEGVHPAQKRLALEEMLAHHLALRELRQRRRKSGAPEINSPSDSWDKLHDRLEFALTAAQERVIDEILSDLSSNHPCLRLVQGDVGSGKTIVAAAAALHAIDNGYQVALMAPTELLAEQHKNTFFNWLDPLGIRCEWLSGKMPVPARRKALERIQDGSAQMVIGTHALFQKEVEFSQPGLLIIDEQHRFGVDQRLALKEKAGALVPHQLIMSATPIPRSMAMIIYADLDVSSIDELPPGRKPVNTVVMPANRRDEIAERIRSACSAGQQAYWVCPLIDESDKLQAQAATNTHGDLSARLPELRIELIHGKLGSRQKELIMQAFKEGKIDLLVSTTVIEVGVDVPNANLMVIENSERLGLAQLHQLRGRVGRGASQATCVLMYDPPLGEMAKNRLGIIRDTNDGFVVAQKDLEHRGPGELMGTRQTGLQQMRIANLVRDRELIPLVERVAAAITEEHPELVPGIVSRWLSGADIYAEV